MGVPLLMRWILETFGVRSSLGKIRNLYKSGSHTHFQFGSFTTTVDYLYLDANGLLHNAAQKVFAYGAFEGRGAEETLYNEEYAMERIYELFYENILRILDIVKVKKVLVIAIDGPAPKAKMNQQRQRRFDVTKRYTNQNISFTSNVITPGTEFMANLTRYVNLQIRKLLNGGASYQVVFSPVTEPGEGEHKIMDYVRSLPPSEKRENVRHCLFGPDADLIMLALSSHLPNIFLLREDQFESGYYFYLDMGNVRNTLASKMMIPSVSKDKISDDFVMMGFFVGNDFLPRIQMFHMLPDGLRLMIQTYSSLVKANPRFTLIQNKNLSLEGFRAFVNALSGNEPSFLIDQVTTKDPKKQPPEAKYVNNTILKNVAHGLQGSTLQLKSFKKDYYAKSGIVVGENGRGDGEIEKMCEDYMKTLSWIHKYYTYGIPAWQWSYTYHYAPLMYDLKAYLTKITPKQFEALQIFEKGEPLLPFEQLLGVLPPSSKTLLPLEYQHLFEEGLLVESGYFPSEIKHDYEGKLKEHEAVSLIPFTEPDVLREAYKSVNPLRAYSRNAVDYASTYQYDLKYSVFYASDFGKIPTLHVRRTKKMCSALSIPEHNNLSYVNNLKNNVSKLFDGTIPDFSRYFQTDMEAEFRSDLKKLKKKSWEPRSKADEIKNMIPKEMVSGDLKILDFGAGDGKVLQSVSQALGLKKENAIAYDLKQVPASKDYVVVKTLNDVQDHSMDCIVLFEVLHHISPNLHQNIAKTLLSKLKKGGIVIVKEHDFIEDDFWLNYLNLIHEMWYVYQNEKPDVLYPVPNTFERIMELFGGKCLKVEAHTEGNYQRIFKVCLKVA